MKVSLDGGNTWVVVERVEVLYEGLTVDGKSADLHLNMASNDIGSILCTDDGSELLGETTTTVQDKADNLFNRGLLAALGAPV